MRIEDTSAKIETVIRLCYLKQELKEGEQDKCIGVGDGNNAIEMWWCWWRWWW